MALIPFKNRTCDPKAPIEVYLNLHKTDDDGKSWYSIRQFGLVIGHADRVSMYDVKFVVNKAGRDRVRIERRKNVHAWVKGFYTESLAREPKRDVIYNPIRDDSFMAWDEHWCDYRPLGSADVALLTKGGTVAV